MVKTCKLLYVALVLSGDGTRTRDGGSRCDAWANANDEFAAKLIKRVWKRVLLRREVFMIDENLDIRPQPRDFEARKVSTFRTRQ
jgi:hypothetical protein